ncbi:MAG: hypothetical protein ABIH39_03920 [Candidatus Margulisiibacteriota bacterium]
MSLEGISNTSAKLTPEEQKSWANQVLNETVQNVSSNPIHDIITEYQEELGEGAGE